MPNKNIPASINGSLMALFILLNGLIVKAAFTQNPDWYYALLVSVPVLMLSIYKARTTKHSTDKNLIL